MKNLNRKKFYGFTLVELLIVITILAILMIIAFMSFKSYTKNSRDSNRMASLTNIETALQLVQVKTWEYPMPDTISGTGWMHDNSFELVYVGNINENITRLANIRNIPYDPLSQENYFYGISADKRLFQIGSIFENLSAYSPIISSTYADEELQAYVKWNYNKMLPYTYNNTFCIANIPSLIFNSGAKINLQDEWVGFVLNKMKNLPSFIHKNTIIPTSEILHAVSMTGAVGYMCDNNLTNQKNFSTLSWALQDTLWYPPNIIGTVLYGDDFIHDDTSSTGSVSAPLVYNNCTGYNTNPWVNDGFAGGDGSSWDPYLICNDDQLTLVWWGVVGSGYYFKLVSNIDIAASTWEPIGNQVTWPFIWSFDGDNYTINNININKPSNNTVWFFWFISWNSPIQNLTLKWWDIVWNTYVGGLFGFHVWNGDISNITTSFNNISGADFVWWVSGYMLNNNMSQIQATTNNISGTDNIWWIVWRIQNNISNSTSNSHNITWWNYVGWLAGRIDGTALNLTSVSNDISWNGYVGWLVWYNQLSINTASSTSNDILGTNTYVWWLSGRSHGNVINANATSRHITGRWTTEANVGGLIGWLEGTLSGSTSNSQNISGSGTYVGGLIWWSQQSVSNSYSTSNNIVWDEDYVWGLIGRWHGAISWSHATSNNITGKRYTGWFAWRYDASSALTNSYSVSQDITGTQDTWWFLWRLDSDLQNSYSTTRNVSWTTHVGWFIGWKYMTTSIQNSHSTTQNIVWTWDYVWWFIGYHYGPLTSSYSITNNISTPGNYVGWFLWGSFSTSIHLSYSTTNDISGDSYVWGFIGSANTSWGPVTITNSYSNSHNITGTNNYIGWFIGANYNDTSKIYSISNNITWVSYIGWLIWENSWSGSYMYSQTNIITGTNTYIGGFMWRNLKNTNSWYAYMNGIISTWASNVWLAVGWSTQALTNVYAHNFAWNILNFFEYYDWPTISWTWQWTPWSNTSGSDTSVNGMQTLTNLSFINDAWWDTNIWWHTAWVNASLPFFK